MLLLLSALLPVTQARVHIPPIAIEETLPEGVSEEALTAIAKAFDVSGYISRAWAEVMAEHPILEELLMSPQTNITDRVMALVPEAREHLVGRPGGSNYVMISEVNSWWGATNVGNTKISRNSGGPADKDATCAKMCDDAAECEWFLRATNAEDCWLMKGFRGYSYDTYRRVGISNNQQSKCALVKVALKKVQKKIDDQGPITNAEAGVSGLRLELPTDYECVAAQHERSKTFVLAFPNVNLKVATGFDLRAQGKNLFGNATAFMRLDLQAALDYNKWQADAVKVTVPQMHIGMQTLESNTIAHWISGSTYAALKTEGTCDDMIVGYAANDIGGTLVDTQYIDGMWQFDANRECCRRCDQNMNCDGFVIERTDYTSRKKCWLKQIVVGWGGRHGNYAGQLESNSQRGQDVGTQGSRIGYHDLPGGFEQDDLDEFCGAMCKDSPECQIWMDDHSSTKYPRCWLQRAFKLDGGVVQQVANSKLAAAMTKGLQTGMNHLIWHAHEKCQKDGTCE